MNDTKTFVYKGVFWYIPSDNWLLCVKVKCDVNGNTLEPTIFSSKSGENFNHKAEWENLPRKVTRGLPYNHFPRGRVEVGRGKATIYLNPALIDYEEMIVREFSLGDIPYTIKADNSAHYQYEN